jgi:hypothetical protein
MENLKRTLKICFVKTGYIKKTICGNTRGFAVNYHAFFLMGKLRTNTGGFTGSGPPYPVGSNVS